jgi:hypothetical protein
MKSYFILVIISSIWLLLAITPGKGEQVQQVQQVQAVQAADTHKGALRPDINFGKVPLYFMTNKGQVNEKVLFYARASKYTLWLTKQGLVFDSIIREKTGEYPDNLHSRFKNQNSKLLKRDVSRLLFLDANKNPEMVPVDETKLKVNYFKGKDKSQWHGDIPTSQAVLYKSIYKNIDLKVYGIEKEIEYDWIVKPGGNPEKIRFAYKNVKSTRLNEEGNLLIETDFGELMHKKPVAYQKIGEAQGKDGDCYDEGKNVAVKFKKITENTYGFEVGEYDKSRALIIDPVVLAYSTYLGGDGDDSGNRIAVDSSGYAYITGTTSSTDFPTMDQYQSNQVYKDVFIAKIDPTKNGASSLIYSTYLGGSDSDYSKEIAVDSNGCAYVTGDTSSTDFPGLNQYQSFQGNSDTFITKLDTTKSGTSSLIYSTYLGGSNNDYSSGIAVDGSGCAYVTGWTWSSDFPTLNPYQSHRRKYDTFITKLDTTKKGNSSLIYSTYLGGSDSDFSRGIAVDSNGYVYVTGYTFSKDFPTLNQYQSFQGSIDTFITKLDTTKNGTSSLIYSTYLGGSDSDEGYGIAVDGSGCAYFTGYTWSSDFPTLNQYQSFQGSIDTFITKLDTTKNGTSSLIYSTYLGGNKFDYGCGIAVDGSGCAYVTGNTYSSDFPTLDQYQSDRGNTDAFITKVDTMKKGISSLIYSTYLGGSYLDGGHGIAVDNSGFVYVTGGTKSSDFPTLNPYQAELSGEYDVFITKLFLLCTGTPSIELNRSSLYFGAVNGGSQTDPQTFSVNINGGCSMYWTTSCDKTWIKVTPTEAAGSALATVSVDTDGLAAGTYTGTISITCASASNSPQNVTVSLSIHDAATTSVPFGDFSTPPDVSLARSSIPVTGWVLDDIQVESVKIYRDGSVYVGDAVFVDGARPDVEDFFPNYPFNYRAGWGYMLLTNFFPNGGNGIFTLSAVAIDKEGNQVTLGSKTITCDNANAIKPFGAIDTPPQGEIVSGSSYVNWGWVLTPQPNSIPTDGSTIHVYVDGVSLGNPNYNNYREDIATLFPGYANSNGAVGYLYLDTTDYTNGTHTIYWTAEDDAGNRDGIGSRYFNIRNTSSVSQVLNAQQPMFNGQSLFPYVEPGELPIDYSTPVTVKKGCARNIEPQKVYPDDNGIITIETRELERVVIHLDGIEDKIEIAKKIKDNSKSYIGYLVINNELRRLPIGSTFDTETGTFYWQPGPAFIGRYDFVFIQKGLEVEWQKKLIRVVINPGL